MSRPDDRVRRNLPGLLRRARLQAGISTVEAAQELGVRRPAIWELENGRRNCKGEELAILAKLYGVSVSWLLERASSKARDDRAALAAGVLAHLSDEALGRLEKAIRIVKERRSPGVNLPPW